jgi:hypothetical protein
MTDMREMRRLAILAALSFAACARPGDPDGGGITAGHPGEAPTVALTSSASSPSAPAGGAPHEATGLGYPWLTHAEVAAGSSLRDRFTAPAGFVRVDVAPRSFGGWLRALPLAPPGTPVRSFDGRVILPEGHESLAAVVTLDVGDRDLQQCADSVIRLHAEWLFARSIAGRAASA